MGKSKKVQKDVLFGSVVRSYLLFTRSRSPQFIRYAGKLFHALFYEAPELETVNTRELNCDLCMAAAKSIREPGRRLHLRLCLYDTFCYAARRGWCPPPQPPLR